MSIFSRRIVARLALTVVAVVILLPAILYFHNWLVAPPAACRATPLMFHRIIATDEPSERYAMRQSEFERQLEQLKAAGARTRPTMSLVEAIDSATQRGGCPFLPNEVVLTFDLDGASRDLENAVPILKRMGFDAVMFAPSGFISHGPMITTSEISAIAESGMTIGSHTEFHQDLRYQDRDTMVASLIRSRDTLRALSGQPVLIASAPGGRYNDRVLADLPSTGLKAFFTSDPCYIRQGASPYQLCRIEIRGDGGMTAAQALRSPARVAWQGTQWELKRLLEAVVGRRLWAVIHSVGGTS